MKRALFEAPLQEFKKSGWTVRRYRENGCGTSVRVIEKTIEEVETTRIFEASGAPARTLRELKNKTVRWVVALRTSQTGTLGLVRDATDTHWAGMSGVDVILVSCVDDPRHPSHAILHLLDAKTAVGRFTKEYNKRSKKAKRGKKAPTFLPLTDLKSQRDLKYFRADTGILPKQEHRVSLTSFLPLPHTTPVPIVKKQPIIRYTIREIRRLLAQSLGVDVADVHISILPGNSRGRVRHTSEQLSTGQTREALSNACVDALQKNRWTLSKGHSVRGRNSRLALHENGTQEHIKIVTSQSGSIAFTRDPQDQYWVELQGIDRVIIGCLDDPKKPLYAVVHAITSDFLKEEFDRARWTKMREAKTWKPTSPLWLPIHAMSSSKLDRASVCMDLGMYALLPRDFFEGRPAGSNDAFLTIPEAKRLIAISYHVDESDVLIAIRSGGGQNNKMGRFTR